MTSTRTGLRMAYFGHNRRDTAFIRRIRGFLEAGIEVTTYTYRRDGEAQNPGPDWPNVDLGHVDHGRFYRRIWLYLGALGAIVKARKSLATATVVYARNLDIFLFAWLASIVATPFGRRPEFVYECLDVHEALLGDGLRARVLRAVERRVLSKASLLVVSSPGFIKYYFEPTQGFTGRWHWIENKLHFPDHAIGRPGGDDRPASVAAAALTIGWVGIIRCQKTLDLLVAVAKALPEQVHIRITGLVSYFLLPDFDDIVKEVPNVEFRGPYKWPAGLADAYRDTDLVWAQELSWSGGNSDWLIPNRVYEASYFGVPSLAIGPTQTGSIVAERNLGFVLPEPSSATLQAFLANLSSDDLAAARRRLLDMPDSHFVLQADDTDRLLAAIENSSPRLQTRA